MACRSQWERRSRAENAPRRPATNQDASGSGSEPNPTPSIEVKFLVGFPLRMVVELLKRVLEAVSFEKGMEILKGSSSLHPFVAPAVYRDIFLVDRGGCRSLIQHLSAHPSHQYAHFIRRAYVQMGFACKTATFAPHPLYESCAASAMLNAAEPNHKHPDDLQRVLAQCQNTLEELVVHGTTYGFPEPFGQVFTDTQLPIMTHLEPPIAILSANARTRDKLSHPHPYSFVASNWASLRFLRIYVEEDAYDTTFHTKQVNFTDFSRLTRLCLVFGSMMDRRKVRKILVAAKVPKTLQVFAIEWGKGIHVPFTLDTLSKWTFDNRVIMLSTFDADKLIGDSHGSVHRVPTDCRELLHCLV
ncbi:hypothetical protein PQX77_006129 [Marasmius sp. AFHP31]|nr:hypothetical protein PQX77_006129 [Marasmius sp. AFHP31]